MVEAPEFLANGARRRAEPVRSRAGDVVLGLSLVVVEGFAYVAVTFAVGFEQWGGPTVASRQHVRLSQTAHWITGLIAAALVIAAVAAWRRAPWTAGLQVLAALVLASLLSMAYHRYGVTHPQPSSPNTGPFSCRTGSGDCPGG